MVENPESTQGTEEKTRRKETVLQKKKRIIISRVGEPRRSVFFVGERIGESPTSRGVGGGAGANTLAGRQNGQAAAAGLVLPLLLAGNILARFANHAVLLPADTAGVAKGTVLSNITPQRGAGAAAAHAGLGLGLAVSRGSLSLGSFVASVLGRLALHLHGLGRLNNGGFTHLILHGKVQHLHLAVRIRLVASSKLRGGIGGGLGGLVVNGRRKGKLAKNNITKPPRIPVEGEDNALAESLVRDALRSTHRLQTHTTVLMNRSWAHARRFLWGLERGGCGCILLKERSSSFKSSSRHDHLMILTKMLHVE